MNNLSNKNYLFKHLEVIETPPGPKGPTGSTLVGYYHLVYRFGSMPNAAYSLVLSQNYLPSPAQTFKTLFPHNYCGVNIQSSSVWLQWYNVIYYIRNDYLIETSDIWIPPIISQIEIQF